MAEWEDDEALAARYGAEGDAGALETLFRRHVGGTYGFARRFLDIREDAEEAVPRRGCGRAAPCARGVSGASRGFRRGCWLSPAGSGTGPPAASADPLPQRAAGDGARRLGAVRPRARAHLGPGPGPAALSDDHRLVLTLCDLQGLTDAEAAKVLGRTPSATKSLRARARRALRDALPTQKEAE